MSFGLSHFKSTVAGIATSDVLRQMAAQINAAAKAGEPPILTIAPAIEQHLGDRRTNELVGRMIREWLGPSFRVRGRRKWKRQHNTESGSFYAYIC